MPHRAAAAARARARGGEEVPVARATGMIVEALQVWQCVAVRCGVSQPATARCSGRLGRFLNLPVFPPSLTRVNVPVAFARYDGTKRRDRHEKGDIAAGRFELPFVRGGAAEGFGEVERRETG